MINQKDMLILSYLRENGRVSLTKLAKHTSIPISTLHDKIRKNSLIKKYTSILDFSKLGYELSVNIMLKVKKEQRKLLKEFIQKSFHVNSAYVIDNHYDVIIECYFKNLREMYHFLDSIDEMFKYNKKEVFYVIEALKKEEFMSDPIAMKARGFV